MVSGHRHHWHYDDETERRKWQDPEAALREIDVRPGMVFVDIACGEGFFTLPAARMVGPQGRVYGVDSNGEAIKNLARKAAAAGLRNIELETAAAENTVLCRSGADIVFFGTALHDFDSAAAVLRNARRMLKPDGKLADLDWKKMSMSFGPPPERRFDEEKASRLIREAGFGIESVRDCGQYHYLILAHPV